MQHTCKHVTRLKLIMTKTNNNWEKFLKDMGWNDPEYAWTVEKQRVLSLLKSYSEEMDGVVGSQYYKEKKLQIDKKFGL